MSSKIRRLTIPTPAGTDLREGAPGAADAWGQIRTAWNLGSNINVVEISEPVEQPDGSLLWGVGFVATKTDSAAKHRNVMARFTADDFDEIQLESLRRGLPLGPTVVALALERLAAN